MSKEEEKHFKIFKKLNVENSVDKRSVLKDFSTWLPTMCKLKIIIKLLNTIIHHFFTRNSHFHIVIKNIHIKILWKSQFILIQSKLF